MLDDPEVVRREYASEAGLRARRAVYPADVVVQLQRVVLEAVAEARPQRVLEVGCGWGDFSALVARELAVDVVAVDSSPRMVELAREAGVDARVADVQDLPHADADFDCVVANWMLYHVPDLQRGLTEIARVLRPGGRLVAATSSHEHLAELWTLVGRNRASEPARFFAETGEEALLPHFSRVERREVRTEVVFPDAEAVRGYIAAGFHKHLADRVPDLEGPLTATCSNAVFVAKKAP